MLKVVDVPQKVAIEACLRSSGSLLDKVDRATRKCLGDDKTFDWDDFNDINTVESWPKCANICIKLTPGLRQRCQRPDHQDGECRGLFLPGSRLAEQ